LVEEIYRNLHKVRNDWELVAYYAANHLALATHLRKHLGFDLYSFTANGSGAPVDPSGAVAQAWRFLDGAALTFLKLLAEDSLSRNEETFTFDKVQAAILWKSYLRTLHRPVSIWVKQDAATLASFRILSTVDLSQARDALQLAAPAARNDVRDGDWPPKGFLSTYTKHRDLVEQLCRRHYGTSLWS
jgi:hypothetical protein